MDTENEVIEDKSQDVDADDSSPEEIEEAKSLGWKSPAEWKGSPPKNGFVKAKEYVERGKTVLPIVRAENAKLQKELTEARQELKDFREQQSRTFASLQRMSTNALKRQRDQLEEKYATAIDAAAEVGDKAAVGKLRKEEKEALKEFDEEAAEKTAEAKDDDKGKKQELPAEITAWVKENQWFEDDDAMKAVAITHHGKLLRDHPNWPLDKNLAEVRKYIEKRFPSEFADNGDETEEDDTDEKPARRGSRVEGSGSRQGGAGQRSAWSRIPDEAKKQGDRFIKEDGLFLKKGETTEKDLQKARERYAEEYLEIDQ